MFNNDLIDEMILDVQHSNATIDDAKKAIGLLDLTNLDLNTTDDEITKLCSRAKEFHVAAVCIYPRFISLAKKLLENSPVKVATVANFPSGDADISEVQKEILFALEKGADEIDVVMPYKKLMAGLENEVFDFLKSCKHFCGDKTILKVILESGELKSRTLIADASRIAIEAGADFIKTSTGKSPIGATTNAVAVMLSVIKHMHQEHGRNVGFKASGGVRTMRDVSIYFSLARAILNEDFLQAKTFRIGASSLLDNIIEFISK